MKLEEIQNKQSGMFSQPEKIESGPIPLPIRIVNWFILFQQKPAVLIARMVLNSIYKKAKAVAIAAALIKFLFY